MIRFASPLLALVAVVGVAAGGSGDRDYELTIIWANGQELHVPAKSRADCEAAMDGWWQPLNMPPIEDAVWSCTAHPGYFSATSNCIASYNCK